MTTAAVAPYSVEERVVGDTTWVALRARGSEWSWLTPQEAAQLGQDWVERYWHASTREEVKVAATRLASNIRRFRDEAVISPARRFDLTRAMLALEDIAGDL